MLIYFLLLYCGIFLSPQVTATGEHEIKRGQYPFMAFLYYPDDKLLDESGARFLRAAILIHENWLISASVEGRSDVHVGFPRKTLLARLGATHIDANYTLNEDEDEQEREIVQIVKPANHNKMEWWLTDINLLKTLLPFNMTSTVGITMFHPRRESFKKCSVLVYSSRHHNRSDERFLMKLHVELLPPTKEECGAKFNADTMICGGESDDNTHELSSTMFCEGNRGGPLMCSGDIIGLQTYIDDCKPPFLYQLLSSWENLISCGIEEKCSEEKCSKVCASIYKDEESRKASTKKAAIHAVSSYFIDALETKNDTNVTSAINSTSTLTSPSLYLTSAGTTTLIMRSDDEDIVTTLSTVTSKQSNETSNVTTTTSNVTTVTANITTMKMDNVSTIIITTSTPIVYPGYYFETTDPADFSDISPTPSVYTHGSPSVAHHTNATTHKHHETTSDMAAEAAQEVTTETFMVIRGRTETTEAALEFFNETTTRTYTKYEPNPEPMTSRVVHAHGYADEDSGDIEILDASTNAVRKKPLTTTSTHSPIISPKPTLTSTSTNGTEKVTPFWPVQKIASIRQTDDQEHERLLERRARMELQQHRERERRYRGAANKSELWSILIFFNILALKCI